MNSDIDIELATQCTHVRTRCYDLLGLAAVHSASVQGNTLGAIKYRVNPTTWVPNTSGGLFDVPNITSMISHSVLPNLEVMEHRHYRTLLTAFLQPYCLSCPLPLFASHIVPVIVPVLVHGTKRINEAWAGWTAGLQDVSLRVVNPCHMPLGVPGPQVEMVQIKIIRDLSR